MLRNKICFTNYFLLCLTAPATPKNIAIANALNRADFKFKRTKSPLMKNTRDTSMIKKGKDIKINAFKEIIRNIFILSIFITILQI